LFAVNKRAHLCKVLRYW